MKLRLNLKSAMTAVCLATMATLATGVAGKADDTMSTPAPAVKTKPANGDAHINQLIEAYIKANPKVVLDAVEQYMAQQRAGQSQQQQASAVGSAKEILARSTVPFIGNPTGTHTIIKFTDYHCGYCKKMDPILADMVKEDPQLKVVMVEIPILGPDSVTAAKAAFAVSLNGGPYEAFHHALFDVSPNISEANIMDVATKTGINTDELKTQMSSKAVADELAFAQAEQQKINVQGTPFFIIDGKTVIGGAVDKASLQKAVAEGS